MGYFKCATDSTLRLRKSSYQDAMKNCKLFADINQTGTIQCETHRFYIYIQVSWNIILNWAEDIEFIRTQLISHNRHLAPGITEFDVAIPFWTQMTRNISWITLDSWASKKESKNWNLRKVQSYAFSWSIRNIWCSWTPNKVPDG